ncbi:MAG: thioredoxin domain-containing protein [Acidimicrobiales bacterium]
MNRLADETSPYLRQHADNPVEWYAWGPDAFARAERDDKPIFLSIGYSACHWCHVMAHESFEDPDTAAVMNELFVNVKVDREERPDVDAVYMDATQAMTGRGGWPMSAFLTPDGRPFFCGTYFPNRSRPGLPSFLEICRAVADAWQHRRDDVLGQAGQLTEAIDRSVLAAAADNGDGARPGRQMLDTAYAKLRAQHDDEWGGFGAAPKFPQPASLDLLLRAFARTRSPITRATVETSLDAMASGGIYDHVGGGFARYSVDAVWLVPHFEKMLYDQAQLARVYLHAWQLTGEARYRQVLDETIGYVLRDLRHADGGFFSAEDADSEGEEGKFYVWTPDEIRAALDDESLAEAAIEHWDVTPEGNFEGRTILNRIGRRGDLVRPPAVETARGRLFEVREARVRPGLDDKVLSEWNGLMLATLAEAAAATGRDDWRTAAVETGEFLLANLRRDDGRWLRSWQADGGARHLAFAADYAALIDAFTRMAEATGDARWLSAATEGADDLLARFWDAGEGGLYTTGDDGERLISRQKDVLDNATPSSNGLAALALVRLAALTGVERYRERADEIIGALGGLAGSHPTAFAHVLAAVDLVVNGITEVVVTGDRPDLVRAVHERWLPNAVVAWGERYASPLWEGRDDGLAYVCRDYACLQPATDAERLVAQLDTAPTDAR